MPAEAVAAAEGLPPSPTTPPFLAGKAVAVTGAGRGIGRAVALACAAEGARVVVADNGVALSGAEPSGDVAHSVVSEIHEAGGEAIAVSADVSQLAGAHEIVGAALSRWGRIDGVVTVAGILRESLLFEMSAADWDDVIATHLRGHFTLFRVASAVMRDQKEGGALVGFTSRAVAGRVAMANYAAAKGGVISLVRSAAAGLLPYGITANAVAPLARTRMMGGMDAQLDGIGEPDDVAPLVVYLLSDQARHITGQVYTVAGPKIAVWNQPQEVRAMFAPGRWTPRDIAARLDDAIGVEPLGLDTIHQVENARTGGGPGTPRHVRRTEG